MKLNNFAVAVMDFFVKASFWLITIVCALGLVGALSSGKTESLFLIIIVWVAGVLIWAMLSAWWLVLSKIAAHLESIDQKTQRISFGFDTGEGQSHSTADPRE